MFLLRVLTIWLIIIAVETIHGILRNLLLVPLVGDFPARQIGVVIGSLLIFAIALVSIRRIAATTKSQLFGAGLIWVILTVLFEISLGRIILNLPWERIVENYNFTRGGFLGLGLLFMLVSPLLASTLRGREPSVTNSSP